MNDPKLTSPSAFRSACGGTARLVVGVLTALAGMAVVAGVVPVANAAPDTSAVTARLYAAPAGHGTACSRARPCRAATAVKEAAKDFKFFNVRVVVHLARGIYHTRLNADILPPSGAKSITIEGPSRAHTVINAGGAGSALTLGADTAPITVIGLELTHGKAPSSTGIGGGIDVGGGDVMVIDCLITGNRARAGGGIGASGGKVIVRSSTISGNTASQNGGGLSDTGGSVTVVASTVNDNSVSGGLGGGVFAEDAALFMRDSTVAGNQVGHTLPGTGSGGGIAVVATTGRVIAMAVGSTLSHNQAAISGGAVWATGSSTFKFGADILAADQAPTGAECAAAGATFTDLGFNVLDDSSCPHRASTKVTSTSAIGLHPLARNGGPTRTERIGRASAAHDLVPVTVKLAGAPFCAGTDQRGVPRRQGHTRRCDAGAYQFAPPHIVHITPTRGAPGTKVTITGYGFDFVALRFGSALPRVAVNRAQTAIIVRVPSRRPATVTIRLSNLDGTASRTFKIIR
jgi:hypothetical protein